jgi:hypothetical protein
MSYNKKNTKKLQKTRKRKINKKAYTTTTIRTNKQAPKIKQKKPKAKGNR